MDTVWKKFLYSWNLGLDAIQYVKFHRSALHEWIISPPIAYFSSNIYDVCTSSSSDSWWFSIVSTSTSLSRQFLSRAIQVKIVLEKLPMNSKYRWISFMTLWPLLSSTLMIYSVFPMGLFSVWKIVAKVEARGR